MSNEKKPWLNKWQIVRPLSKGGQGETILVEAIDDPSRIGVLKTLRNQKSKQARGRMRIEVSSLDTLSYEGIKVPIIFENNASNFKDESVSLFFVMQYIEGETLDEMMKRCGPLALDAAAAMTIDLGDTIAAAHAMGVSHRDLKPSNIMVRDANKPDLVIVDYGLSFNRADDLDENVTIAGEQFRNEFLALPETNTIGGDKRDLRIDVTALCAIFYYCLTGHAPGQIADGRGRPPHRRDGNQSVRSHLTEDARVMQVELLFDRGFSIDVEHRYQSCQEFITRLHQVLAAPRNLPDDPKTLAAALGAELQKRDRKTQLELQRQAALLIAARLNTEFLQSHHRSISPFEIIGTSGYAADTTGLPKGIDILSAGVSYTVSLQVHGVSRTIKVSFGSSGDQILMVVFTEDTMSINKVKSENEPELLWFNRLGLPSTEALLVIMKRQLNFAMQSMYDTALSNNTIE